MQADQNGSVAWMDVKETIEAVCNEMQPGEMMHGPHFSMTEAMAAIEIGDPKMDQGARLATSPDASLTFKQLLDTHAPTSLSAADVLAACDAMMAAEVTWHQGATMPQSLFSALYLHDLTRYFTYLCVCWLCIRLRMLVVCYTRRNSTEIHAISLKYCNAYWMCIAQAQRRPTRTVCILRCDPCNVVTFVYNPPQVPNHRGL